MYLNDVETPDGGPVVFVNKPDAMHIRWSPVIRRIPDERFFKELGAGRARTFYGRAGDSIWIDPSVCYHYGSRCKRPRFAIFVTFFTDRPFVDATEPIRANKERLYEVARTIRPELSNRYLASLFR